MITIIPTNYVNKLSNLDTQKAIKLVKDTFEQNLAKNLNLLRVSAPLFVQSKTGLNDNLSGLEKPVSFTIKGTNDELEIVHSLAKWKRMALKRYEIPNNMGLYTDMNAIRREEDLDNLHSIYVDQWDWEKIITRENRNLDYLKEVVRKINLSLTETLEKLKSTYNQITFELSKDVYFITSEELLQRFPHLSSKAREDAICKEKGTVFILQIGDKLSNGLPHDSRAADYDDWNLNGDLLIWYPLLDCAIELSSMGIRVDEQSIVRQLEIKNNLDKLKLEYHKSVLENRLPLTIGGGIGQSRLCMIFLEKAHIGEVQASVWDEAEVERLKEYNINIL